MLQSEEAALQSSAIEGGIVWAKVFEISIVNAAESLYEIGFCCCHLAGGKVDPVNSSYSFILLAR